MLPGGTGDFLGDRFLPCTRGTRISFKTMVREAQDRVPQTNPESILYQSDINLIGSGLVFGTGSRKKSYLLSLRGSVIFNHERF